MRQILLVTLGVSYVLLIMASVATGAHTFMDRSRNSLINLQDPDEVAEILQNLEDSLAQTSNYGFNNVKRNLNLDLGFSRGFSGSQAAKHLMGLAAAEHAGGPGRKRQAAPANDID